MLKETSAMSETRFKIIDTALHLFMEHGYHNVTTRTIAAACEISQPALYHHFKDKQALYTEAIALTLQKIELDIQSLIQQYTTTKDCLYEIVFYLLSHLAPGMRQMVYDVKHQLKPEHQQTLEQAFLNALFVPIHTVFDCAIQEGTITPPEKLGSTSFMSVMTFLSVIDHHMNHLPRNTTVSYEKTASFIVHLFLHGLSESS